MRVREIAETISISKERVGYILHEELDMKKKLVQSCVMVTIPTAVYTQLILLMMSSKPARNM
jgi:hypothetical protein